MAGLIVAITGGIASGKSEVARRFGLRDVPVLDADVVARAMVEPGTAGLDAIVQRFGTNVLREEGRLNRAALRQLVFGDDTARRDLETILHPRIRAELQRLCVATVAPYAIAVIPLLAESGGPAAYPWLDRILVVDLPRELQHERLLHRDAITPELADRMLAAQANRTARLMIADDVIDNSGALLALDAQVDTLHRHYLQLAAKRPADR